MIMSCVFCKIVAEELPVETLYKDELILCFLDVAPINPGHSLIIPVEHHASLTTLADKTLSRIMSMAPRIAQAVVREVDGDGFNLHLSNGQCAGQVVLHTHLHIIPRSPTDGFSWGWRSQRYESKEQKHLLVQNVINRLKRNP